MLLMAVCCLLLICDRLKQLATEISCKLLQEWEQHNTRLLQMHTKRSLHMALSCCVPCLPAQHALLSCLQECLCSCQTGL